MEQVGISLLLQRGRYKMSKEEKPEVEVIKHHKLRTPDEILVAFEHVFNQQVNGKIDAKGAETLNKTLYGSVALQKLKMAAADLYLQSKLKKINIPNNMMIEFSKETKEAADSIGE